jgi:AcrR family transcriptional regulator
MTEAREDRRVRRTKRRLKEALMALIEEREYDAITIADLTERADVARSTFYSHYDSKESLLFDGFDRWILEGEVGSGSGGGRESGHRPDAQTGREASGATRRGRPLGFSLPLLRHVRGQERFFRSTVAGRGGGGRIGRRVAALLAERVRRDQGGREGDPEAAARAHAVAGAFMGVMTWWLEDGARLTPEEVDRVFREVVTG